MLYYPLFYFAKVADSYQQWTAKQEQGILPDWSFSSGDSQVDLRAPSSTIEKTALILVIFGPLFSFQNINHKMSQDFDKLKLETQVQISR